MQFRQVLLSIMTIFNFLVFQSLVASKLGMAAVNGLLGSSLSLCSLVLISFKFIRFSLYLPFFSLSLGVNELKLSSSFETFGFAVAT